MYIALTSFAGRRRRRYREYRGDRGASITVIRRECDSGESLFGEMLSRDDYREPMGDSFVSELTECIKAD